MRRPSASAWRSRITFKGSSSACSTNTGINAALAA
jgi:hypothetical protein